MIGGRFGTGRSPQIYLYDFAPPDGASPLVVLFDPFSAEPAMIRRTSGFRHTFLAGEAALSSS